MVSTILVVAAVACLLAYLSWRWWQGQVSQAAGRTLQRAATVAAALALSDPQSGGQLRWEAGKPHYLPSPNSSPQEKALLQAWEMALDHQLSAPNHTQHTALSQQLGPLMPAMLPAANLGLYTPQPRSGAQRQQNLRALAATSLLMERRADRWLTLHRSLLQDLSAQLQQPSTLQDVDIAQWRRKAEKLRG